MASFLLCPLHSRGQPFMLCVHIRPPALDCKFREARKPRSLALFVMVPPASSIVSGRAGIQPVFTV